MHSPKQLPPGLDGLPFTVRDALAYGITRERTRARDLDKPFRGIRTPQDLDRTFIELCRVYATGMTENQYFSHATAGQLLGLPLPLPIQSSSVLHVSAVLPSRAPRAIGVIGHHVRPPGASTVTIDGLRVASAIQTWCDLATVLSLRDLVVVGDALVRRQHPLASLDVLQQVVSEGCGRRGARALREAFRSVRPGVDSPKETEIRLIIVGAGLPEPEVNAVIRNSYGAFIALGDLVYPEYRVLAEYDGAHHFAGDEQIYKDIDRLDNVMAEKWRVVRLNKTHLRHPATIVTKVRTALLDAGWRPLSART